MEGNRLRRAQVPRAIPYGLRKGKMVDFQSAPVVAKRDPDGGISLIFDGPIHTNTSWLEREFKAVVEKKPSLVRLNLTNTEHISSTGLGLLVWLHNHVKALGGEVHVVAVQKRTFGLLKVAFLDKLLKIAPDAVAVAEAANSPKK
jgi:anti-anti-sigma factor